MLLLVCSRTVYVQLDEQRWSVGWYIKASLLPASGTSLGLGAGGDDVCAYMHAKYPDLEVEIEVPQKLSLLCCVAAALYEAHLGFVKPPINILYQKGDVGDLDKANQCFEAYQILCGMEKGDVSGQ